MPTYDYVCNDCLKEAQKDVGRELTDDELSILTFEVKHSMVATDEQIKEVSQCPTCQGHDTKRVIMTVPHARVRGLGHRSWQEYRAENANAFRRDMALHQLHDEDPYGHMRKPGESSDLADRLRKSAKKPSKEKVFDTRSSSKPSKPRKK